MPRTRTRKPMTNMSRNPTTISPEISCINLWNLPLQLPTLKLGLKSIGPFPVAEKFRTSAYHLILPSTWKIHPVFNKTLLHPFQGDPMTIWHPPELKGGGKFYEAY